MSVSESDNCGKREEGQECDWEYVRSYGDWDWVGYGIDAVKVEYGVAVHRCKKCGNEKETEIDED